MRLSMRMRSFCEDPAAPPANPAAPPANPGTPPADPAAPPRSLLGANTPAPDAPAGAKTWLDDLPEGIRADPNLVKYKEGGVPALAEAYVNATRLIGKPADSLLELPTERTLDKLGPVFEKLGAPKDAAGYKLAALEGAHESLGVDKPLTQGFLADAAKAGILPEQAQALYNGFAGRLQAAMQGQDEGEAAADAEGVAALQKEWGPAFDGNVARINHASDFLGLKDVLNSAGLGANPIVAKALLKVEGLLRETPAGQNVPGLGQSHAGLLAPADATARGKALLAQAFAADNQATRRQLNEEAQRYFKMAEGDTTV